MERSENSMKKIIDEILKVLEKNNLSVQTSKLILSDVMKRLDSNSQIQIIKKEGK